jgi:arsenate reductase|tara:strand:- start:242 stop:544 length:303 start_codon:yes stop_codon:yes gene_type:complete
VKLLNEKNVDFDVVEYLKDPLTKDEILILAKKLGKRPKDFIRTSEKDFKDNNVESLINNDQALANAMEELPKIIERPIFVVGKNAVIGRPPENILMLLDK